jgi:methionine-rich copper-binding protein CopC
MSSGPRRTIAGATIAVTSAVLCATIATAHSYLDTVTPADGSTVTSPGLIVMTFTGPLDPTVTNIVLVSETGSVVAQGATIDPTNANRMTLAVHDLAPGVYTVRWTSKSALDGDIVRGTTSFTAVAYAAASTSPGPPAPAAPSAAPAVGPTTSSVADLIPVAVPALLVVGFGAWLLRRRRVL